MYIKKSWWTPLFIVFVVCMFLKPALCFVLMGLIFILMSIVAIRFLLRMKHVGIDAMGSIVTYSPENNINTPMIEFKTISGQIIREKPFVYTASSLMLSRLKGNNSMDEVRVVYDPDKPEMFVISADRTFNYTTFIVFIIAGLLFAGIGVWGLVAGNWGVGPFS